MNKYEYKNDPSLDWINYPTLAPVPAGSRGDLIHCQHCGGSDFHLRNPDLTTICKKCGQKVNAPYTPPIKHNHAHLLPQISGEYILLPNGGVRWLYPKDRFSEVTGWFGITAIATGLDFIAGLMYDGTVMTASTGTKATEYGKNNIHYWRRITALSVSDVHTVGLFDNGTVRAVGNNFYGQCNVQNWKDITSIAVGTAHTVGLCADGTVRLAGQPGIHLGVGKWTNITAIAASSAHIIGLCANGTVVASGENQFSQCSVHNWTDVVAISTAPHFTVGLRKDGTVLATGDNLYNRCEVQGWSNVVEISTTTEATIAMQRDGNILCTDPKLLLRINKVLK